MKKSLPASVTALLALLMAILIFVDAETDRAGKSVQPEAVEIASLRQGEEHKSPEERAAEILARMSPEEKVWQMMVVFPEDLVGVPSLSDQELWADAMLRRPVGGFVISGANMLSENDLRAMLSSISHASDIPVFLCVDEEGGAVARLSYNLGVTTDFKPMFSYREGGESTAYQNALTIAADLRDFGFNVDFAPVADVWTNSENTVIGSRAYSDDAKEAAKLVAAAVEGFTEGGVISTLKHFPGHGDTAEDSHYASAYSSKSLSELEQCEFLPFVSGIQAGAGMVMVGHISLPEIDPELPATLSGRITEGLLRDKLAYDGVVISDSFRMAALDSYSQTQAAVMCIEAGCDIILAPADPDAAVAAILHEVDMRRIDESVLRILKLKLESGIMK